MFTKRDIIRIATMLPAAAAIPAVAAPSKAQATIKISVTEDVAGLGLRLLAHQEFTRTKDALEWINAQIKAWVDAGRELAESCGGVWEPNECNDNGAVTNLVNYGVHLDYNEGENHLFIAWNDPSEHPKDAVYEFLVCYRTPNADEYSARTTLVATDVEHAKEEASYECPGEIIYVRQGDYLYDL